MGEHAPMLIDAHTHAYVPADLEVLRQRLTLLDQSLETGDPNKWQIHGGTLEELVAASARAGAQRLVLLPVSGKPSRVGEMNRWSAQAASDHPAIIPFGLLHPFGPVKEDLDLLMDLGLKGVKLHPFIQAFPLEHPATDQLLDALRETGLPVLLDTIHRQGLLRAKPHLKWVVELMKYQGSEPIPIAKAAAARPELRIIAAHGGCLYGWDHLDPLMDLDNVYFDISYLSHLVEPQRLVAIIRQKGPERVLYGTDAPWRDPVAFREWFEDLPLSTWEREQVAAGTASQLLNL